MGTTIDDIRAEQYHEEQALIEQKEEWISDYENQGIQEKMENLCSYVCNAKKYNYTHKLVKASESRLYDAAIIYAWNIFMLFVFEKVWQLREIERNEDADSFVTDGIFLKLINKGRPGDKPVDYFDGNLFSLNKLHENNQGEEKVIGKLKDVFRGVDQQFFKEAQQILQKRNTSAHVNSIEASAEDLGYVLSKLIVITKEIQNDQTKGVSKIFEHLESTLEWHLSCVDLAELHKLFDIDTNDCQISKKYRNITKLVKIQDFSEESVNAIKKRAITYFLYSHNCKSAYQNGTELVMPLASQFDKDDYLLILKKVFLNKDKDNINQILPADRIEEIFEKLYLESINTYPDIVKDWSKFIKKVNKLGFKEKYKNLSLD